MPETSCTKKLPKNLFYIIPMPCGCSQWGGPRAAASNSNTPVRQAGVEAPHGGMDQTNPHGFLPLDGWLAASCSVLRHQLCQNLHSYLLTRHPKVSRWALMAKAIEGDWGSTGCWTEILVQKRETERVMATLSVTDSPFNFSKSTMSIKGQISLSNKRCNSPQCSFLLTSPYTVLLRTSDRG